MREYTPKDDVQKKSYYSDRFYVAPKLARYEVSSDETYAKDLETLKDNHEILDAFIELDELVVFINPNENISVLETLKNYLEYDFLVELSAIDYIKDRDGFEIFYELLSTSKRKRVRVKTFIKKDRAINSVEKVYRSANFSEREMYDMYGIKINLHSYLKRILMPDDWVGHPLLKSYPLQGDEHASWYEVDKIFGKENRDLIGPEQRDSASVDRYDTTRFAKLGFEVPFGAKYSDKPTPKEYQEERKGMMKLVTKLDPKKSKILKERR
jgi:NADH-quinone oxidoreductase subunit C